MSLVSQISALATRVAQEIKGVRALLPYNVPTTDGCASIRRVAANQSIGDSAWGIPAGDNIEYLDGFTYDYVSGAFLCKKDGVYEVDATVMWLPNVTGRRLFRLYKSATPTVQTGTIIDQSEINPAVAGSGAYAGQTISAQVKCSAGDYIVPQVWQSSGASLTMLNSAFKFQARLPQVFVAGSGNLPLQRCRLRRLGALTLPSNTTTIIPWDIEDEDTHGMWSTGASATVPVGGGGTYRVTARLHVTPAVGVGMLSVFVNGAAKNVLDRNDLSGSPSSPTAFGGSTEIDVNDGDQISIGMYAQAASSIYTTSIYVPEVIIERVPTSQAVVARADSRPPGEITMYGGANVPLGWLACDGSMVQKARYPDLWAAIGDTWKMGAPPAGYFQLPDFTDKLARGAGATLLGQTAGSDSSPLPDHVHPHAHTHTLPDHSHSLSISNNATQTGVGSRTNSPNTGGVNSNPASGGASVANTSNPTTNPAISVLPTHAAVKYMIKAL